VESLAGDPGNIIWAALLESGVVGLTAAAASLSAERLVWESVWHITAAGSLGVLDTILERAAGLLVEGWLHELWVDNATGNEQVEHFQDEHALNLAGAVLAEAGVGDWVNVVETVAVEDEVGFSGTGTWQVLHFPWHARVVSGDLLNIHHAAVITIVQLLAEVVDTVDWLTVASAVVALKVAPASILVESIEVFFGEDVTDGSWLWSVGLDERSDVSVGEIVHLLLHGLEAGLGKPNQ